MKKSIFILSSALLTLLAVSCRKDVAPQDCGRDGQRVTVTIRLSGGDIVKAIQTEEEANVNSIQIFIFNGDVLDTYGKATSQEISALEMSVRTASGKRDIYALCNAPDLSGYTTRTALLEAESKLRDSGKDSFVMSGLLGEQMITANYHGTVQVKRYVSRIRISRITRSFSNPGLQGVAFEIRKVYLTSVASNVKYGGEAFNPQDWLNASFGTRRSLSTDNPFVYHKFSSPVSVAQGGSYAEAIPFYVLPNGAVAQSVTGKDTRLVVECQIDVNGDGSFGEDEIYAYPVYLGAVGRNRTYEIKELIITRLGNSSNGDDNADDGEDDIIETVNAKASVEVLDWSDVLVGDNGTVTI